MRITALAAIASASVAAAAVVKTGVRVSRRAACRTSCAIVSMIPAFGGASIRCRAPAFAMGFGEAGSTFVLCFGETSCRHRSVSASVTRPALSRHHTFVVRHRPAVRAAARRLAIVSSIAAPYSRRSASGHNRTSQRYTRTSRPSGIEPTLPRGADERREALRFLRHGAAPEPGDGEVLPPRIHLAWCGDRRHEALLGQSPQGLVERAGRRIQPSTRFLLDALADGVAVRWAIAERQQDVKRQLAESRCRVGVGGPHVSHWTRLRRERLAVNCSSSHYSWQGGK